MVGLRKMTAAALAAVTIWAWAGGAAALETATVTKTGDMAPGAGGAIFTSFFSSPDLNGGGEVAFQGDLSGGGRGIFVGGPAGLALATKTGDIAPGAGGATFTLFSGPVVNGVGDVAFLGNLSGGGRGIWLGGPAGLALVAKTGDLAPGAGGESFSAFQFPIPNGAGEVAFQGDLSGGGRGIWLGGPAGLALVAKTGDLAPGAGGATFAFFFEFLLPALNGAGEMAFVGVLSGGGSGIWLGGPAGLAPVAKTGDTAPGAGGATFGFFNQPALNGAGEVAFEGGLSDGGGGIWVGGRAGLALVARNGDTAPGAGGPTFTGFNSPVLNGAGEVAFRGNLSDGGRGIWLGGPAGLALVAKTGETAPGAGGPTFTFFDGIGLNGAGEVAFGADLAGGVTPADDRGIWAGPPGGLQLIAREGDDIEVSPGVPRTVANFGLSLAGFSGNEDGRPSSFSEGGQVALIAGFTDTSQGIFLSPPETPTVHRVSYRAVDGGWGPVMLPRSFRKPVIIAGPPGSANKQPGVVRLREIEGAKGRFEARFQEWRYLDGPHPEERTDFLALERGRHKQADGSIWEAGRVKLKGNRIWKKKRFTKRFRKPPEVFVTVQSAKGRTAVAVRVRNVTRDGFEVSIQEEEKDLRGKHPKETVGYLAVYSRTGRGTIAGGVEGSDYRLKQTKLSHRFKSVPGGTLKLEEEKSQDKETKHKKEAVSVMTLGRGLFAQQAGDKEPDTTAIRRR